MLSLVARQWHVVRGASATTGLRHRPQRLLGSAVPAALRSYTRRAKFPQMAPLNGAIIIPTSVPDAQPAELIRFIRPVLPERIVQEPFCVFLVTPSFASWLMDGHVFLEQALSRAYSNWWDTTNGRETPPVEIRALCAVVDKLPVGRAFTQGVTLEVEVGLRTYAPPVAETGLEGIAYVTLPATASVSSKLPSSSEEGAIDFVLGEPTMDEHGGSDILRLPLANTVFQTGTPTTMTFSTWKPRGTTSQLELVSKSTISHHGIRIGGHDRAVNNVTSALNIPLVPLTLPRRVEGCMGNIIRRIKGSDNKVVTASSELEERVPRFFKSRGEAAQATTAWALVIPPSIAFDIEERTLNRLDKRLGNKEREIGIHSDELWERLWRKYPPLGNYLVPGALAQGARLHRVLSGGGGWGKKAGLLSLDPVPNSEGMHQLNTGEVPSMLDDPQDFASTLTPVVQDGDYIQFFVSPSIGVDVEANKIDDPDKLIALPTKNLSGWEFGTIPSTVDSIPGGSWQHNSSSARKVAVFPNTFGALAERGLTLTRRYVTKGDDTFSSRSTTVIDVPFSRLWAVELSAKDGANQDGPIKDSNKNQTSASIFAHEQSNQQQTAIKENNPYIGLPSNRDLARSVLPSKKYHAIIPIQPGSTQIKAIIQRATKRTRGIENTLNRLTRRFKDIIMHAIDQHGGCVPPGKPRQPLETIQALIPTSVLRAADRRLHRITRRLKDLKRQLNHIILYKNRPIPPVRVKQNHKLDPPIRLYRAKSYLDLEMFGKFQNHKLDPPIRLYRAKSYLDLEMSGKFQNHKLDDPSLHPTTDSQPPPSPIREDFTPIIRKQFDSRSRHHAFLAKKVENRLRKDRLRVRFDDVHAGKPKVQRRTRLLAQKKYSKEELAAQVCLWLGAGPEQGTGKKENGGGVGREGDAAQEARLRSNDGQTRAFGSQNNPTASDLNIKSEED